MKITAIHGGTDWYDASADYVVLPEGMYIQEEIAKYRKWYRDVYCPSLDLKTKYIAKRPEGFLTLIDWLLQNGARLPTQDELEIIEN